MTVSAIDCTDVSVRYPNGFVAVSEVNLQLAPGEIVALLGASGSGKSTLLRGIAGLEEISHGTIAINGKIMGGPGHPRVPVHTRNVGMVFQNGLLFPHRSVAGNIGYGLKLSGFSKTDRENRVTEMLKLIEMEDYADRSVTSLSGGQAQRVALARSLAPEPSVLLLDEPLSALDRGLRERLATEIRDILQATHTPALHVTHDFAEAFAVADRVIVMDAGKIVADGTPNELLSTEQHPAVDSVLGADQRVIGTVTEVDDAGAVVIIDSAKVHIKGSRAAVGENVYLRLS